MLTGKSTLNMITNQQSINLRQKRKTLTFGLILDRDASKQIRLYTGSGAPAQNISRSPQPLFMKLAKSHISAQFFVRVYVLGWYTCFETPQVLFFFCFREKGVKTQRIYE